MSAELESRANLLKLADFLRELTDQVSINASANALQSFPELNRQIERADKLRVKIDEFRKLLADSP